jgi:uncharacterized membrane protein YgdD (TMEM256/DUF423 family)
VSEKGDGLRPLARRSIAVGALLMLVAVILGAFGAHGLEGRLAAKQLASYQTGVSYHLLHALGLVAVGVIAQVTTPGRLLEWSARLMLLGIACFSGSIYLLTAGAPRALGAVTPVGGLSFTAAWMLLALHVLRRPG